MRASASLALCALCYLMPLTSLAFNPPKVFAPYSFATSTTRRLPPLRADGSAEPTGASTSDEEDQTTEDQLQQIVDQALADAARAIETTSETLADSPRTPPTPAAIDAKQSPFFTAERTKSDIFLEAIRDATLSASSDLMSKVRFGVANTIAGSLGDEERQALLQRISMLESADASSQFLLSDDSSSEPPPKDFKPAKWAGKKKKMVIKAKMTRQEEIAQAIDFATKLDQAKFLKEKKELLEKAESEAAARVATELELQKKQLNEEREVSLAKLESEKQKALDDKAAELAAAQSKLEQIEKEKAETEAKLAEAAQVAAKEEEERLKRAEEEKERAALAEAEAKEKEKAALAAEAEATKKLAEAEAARKKESDALAEVEALLAQQKAKKEELEQFAEIESLLKQKQSQRAELEKMEAELVSKSAKIEADKSAADQLAKEVEDAKADANKEKLEIQSLEMSLAEQKAKLEEEMKNLNFDEIAQKKQLVEKDQEEVDTLAKEVAAARFQALEDKEEIAALENELFEAKSKVEKDRLEVEALAKEVADARSQTEKERKEASKLAEEVEIVKQRNEEDKKEWDKLSAEVDAAKERAKAVLAQTKEEERKAQQSREKERDKLTEEVDAAKERAKAVLGQTTEEERKTQQSLENIESDIAKASATTVKEEPIEPQHPILGPVISDLGYKRVHLVSSSELEKLRVWKRNRIYRPERAQAMASDKQKTMNIGFPGVICLHEDLKGKLRIIDGQHRVGMMQLLRELPDSNEHLLDKVLVEVYPQPADFPNSYMHAMGIFEEINKAEPVKLIDMPSGGAHTTSIRSPSSQVEEEDGGDEGDEGDEEDEGDEGDEEDEGDEGDEEDEGDEGGEGDEEGSEETSEPSVGQIITDAVELVKSRHLSAFSISSRCPAPFLNADNLRDDLFRANVVGRYQLTTSEELVEWLTVKNRSMQQKHEQKQQQWYLNEGRDSVSRDVWDEAKRVNFFLGLESSWLYD